MSSNSVRCKMVMLLRVWHTRSKNTNVGTLACHIGKKISQMKTRSVIKNLIHSIVLSFLCARWPNECATIKSRFTRVATHAMTFLADPSLPLIRDSCFKLDKDRRIWASQSKSALVCSEFPLKVMQGLNFFRTFTELPLKIALILRFSASGK